MFFTSGESASPFYMFYDSEANIMSPNGIYQGKDTDLGSLLVIFEIAITQSKQAQFSQCLLFLVGV